VLAVISLWLRHWGLDPSSLWLDDAWVSAAASMQGWTGVLSHSQTAPGFTLLVRPFVLLGGDRPLAAQVVPAAAGAVGPGLLYLALVDRRLRRVSALLAAIVLLGSPGHAQYSIYVKQYTLEVVLTIMLVWCAWSVVDDGPSRRRWSLLLLTSVVSFVISASMAIVVVPAVGVAGWHAWRASADRRAVVLTAAGAAAFGLVWTGTVIVPRLSERLNRFWAFAYIDTGSGAGAAWDSLYERSSAVVISVSTIPPGLALLALVAGAGALLWRRPAIGLLLCGPVVLAVVLSAAELVPLGIGNGRTDLYLFPLLILLVVLGLDTLADRLAERVRTPAVGVVAVAALLLPLDLPRYSYAPEDLRPLVGVLEVRREPGDGVIVYPLASFSFGLYTTWPVEMVRSDQYPAGWEFEVHDPDVTVLRDHRIDPARYRPVIADVTAGHDRVWLIASHMSPDLQDIRDMLERRDLEVELQVGTPGAVLELWARSPSTSGDASSRRE
jgi:4-amino-4-deoxy-L-arabinose transferase-like glycosyltransferase